MRVLKLVSEKVGFATNSSSYHQVVFRPNKGKDFEVDLSNISKDHPVHIGVGEFGWGGYGECLRTWEEKASYVLTWYCHKINYPIRVGQKLNEMKELRGFKKMLERHVGEGCVVIDGEVGPLESWDGEHYHPSWDWQGDLDHQSLDTLDGQSPETLEEMIFSNSYIWIENDNGDTHEQRQWNIRRG